MNNVLSKYSPRITAMLNANSHKTTPQA